jgi:hypothetical protein
VTPADEKPPTALPSAPQPSSKGQKRADEKFERQAAQLRANLRRRNQQRRGQGGDKQVDDDPDSE